MATPHVGGISAAAGFASRAAVHMYQSLKSAPLRSPMEGVGGLLRSNRSLAAGVQRISPQLRHMNPQLRGLATLAYKPESAAQDPAFGGRTFVDMSLFKGKGALNLKVIKPTWEVLPNGDRSIARAGVMLLEFAPAGASQGAQSSYGSRSYDWGNKQNLGLSAVELGSIIGARPGVVVEIFHDPGMNSPSKGQVTKSLKIQPGQDSKGALNYIFNFTVKDAEIKPNGGLFVVIPVTEAEMTTMKELLRGWVPSNVAYRRETRFRNVPARIVEGQVWCPHADGCWYLTRVKL